MSIRFFINASLFFLSLSSLADNLVIAKGFQSYDEKERRLKIINPTIKDMVEKAKVNGILNIAQRKNYHQVQMWEIDSFCEPIHGGSQYCYQAYAEARTSFVLKSELNKTWIITTEGKSSVFKSDTKMMQRSLNEASQNAKAQAVFACAKREIVERPESIKIWCDEDEHPLDGWCDLHVKSEFYCPPSPN